MRGLMSKGKCPGKISYTHLPVRPAVGHVRILYFVSKSKRVGPNIISNFLTVGQLHRPTANIAAIFRRRRAGACRMQVGYEK